MTDLELQGITHSVPKTDGGRRVLVADLDVRCTSGTLTAIVGPNGAGKSTLLRDAVGVTTPDAGSVLLGGSPLAETPRRLRAVRLSYLPQHWDAPYDLPAAEVVMLGRTPHQTWLGGESDSDRTAVQAALRFVDAEDLADRNVSTLSGGERQRVRLARMLATDSDVLVLDEPTTALDVGHALRLLALLRRLADTGRTVVTALHHLEWARRYADHVVCLTGGDDGAHRQGPPADLLVPEVLDPVFGVRTRVTDGGLAFDPVADSSDDGAKVS